MKSPFGNVYELQNKTPIKYASEGEAQSSLYGGKPEYTVQLGTYQFNSTLFSVVNFLSSTTAQVDWKLYRKSTTGNKSDRQEVTVHPALSILYKPTNFDTRQDLFEATQQHVDLTGEGWWVIERMGSMPTGLWLARPDRMTVVKSPTEFLLGYKYTQPDGSQRPLAKEDVIQLRMPNPLDPYRGLSPLSALLLTIDTDTYADLYQKNFFKNGAVPGGIMNITENMSDQEWQKNLQRWNMQHKGVGNANRTAFVENGKYQVIAPNQVDMQFAELKGFNKDTIREAYGVSKAMLGVVDDVNRANNEAQESNYAKYKLTPRLERFKSALNNEYLPQFGGLGLGLEFDYDDIEIEDQSKIIADRDSKIAAVVALINAGADPKATLAAFNLPEIPFTSRSNNEQI